MQYNVRNNNLKKRLKELKLDGLLITKSENIRYLCGFAAEDSALLVTAEKKDFVITNLMFAKDAQKNSGGFCVRIIGASLYNTINKLSEKYKIKRLGFESDWLAHSAYIRIKEGLKKAHEIVPTKHVIEDLRIIKDDEELKLIRKTAEIVKKVYSDALGYVRPGLNGKRLAAFIDNSMRRHGASGSAFSTIVAQEPYSSSPHARTSSVPFDRNSCVLIDMGAVYEGYSSDLTRIVFLGRITSKIRQIYKIILTAQRIAFEKIAPGVNTRKLDSAARRYIKSRGFGRYFIHGLGHGVGLEIHESPTLSRKSGINLKPGMVFTVEPGIYIPGFGGLRLEDMVVVTSSGYEVLTCDIPK